MDLLAILLGTLLVPDAVFREVTWYGARRPAAADLAAPIWAIRVNLEIPADAVLRLRPSPIHRRSFAPVSSALPVALPSMRP